MTTAKTKSKSPKPKQLNLVAVSQHAEPLLGGNDERAACQTCGRAAKCDAPYLWPSAAHRGSKFLVVFGQRISEEAFDLVQQSFRAEGADPGCIVYVDAVRCALAKTPTTAQLRACRPFLLTTINEMRPTAILAFGSEALRALTNNGKLKTITPIRGIPYVVPDVAQEVICYGTYDPNELLKGNFHHAVRVAEDIRRLVGKLPTLAPPREGRPQVTTVALDTEYETDGRVLTVSTADSVSAHCGDLNKGAAPSWFQSDIRHARVLQGHNVAVDVDALARLDGGTGKLARAAWLRGENLEDSMLLAKMTDENRGKGGYKLEVLTRSSYNVKSWKAADVTLDESHPATWPTDYRLERCRQDAWASALLCNDYGSTASGPIVFTHRVAQTIRRIYHAGAAVDLGYLKKLARGYERESAQLRQTLTTEAFKHGMSEFVPTNDNHLRELLYKRMKLASKEKTKGGLQAVTATVLKQFDAPLVNTLREFNKVDKLRSTYGKSLIDRVADISAGHGTRVDGIRFSINSLGARTGRRSSDKPNAQNWPKAVRKIIVSRFRDGAIVDNDYSKLEVILFAWQAGEWDLLDFFLSAGNGYIKVGKELFGKDVEEDTPDYRTVKSIVLGIQYNMGGWKLANQLWTVVGVKLSADWDAHVEKSYELRERYLRRFPGIKRFVAARRHELLTTQQVVSLTGRVRHLPCPYGEDTPGFGHLLNEAVNFPIQSLASDVTGSAMIDCEEALLDCYGISYPEYHGRLLEGHAASFDIPLLINEVHDDLVYDVPVRHRADNLALISEVMAEIPTLRQLCPQFDVPLKAGQKVGSRWGMDDLNS